MKQAMRINKGAIVFSDHSFPHWGEHIGVGQEDRLFKFDSLDTRHNRYDLRAWGFGLTTVGNGDGAYGNGSLFVSREDTVIVDVTDEEYAAIFKPAIPVEKPKRKKPGYWLVVGDGYSDIVKISSDGLIRQFSDKFSIVREDFFNANPHWYGPLDLREIMDLEILRQNSLPVDIEKAKKVAEELQQKETDKLRKKFVRALKKSRTYGFANLTMSHSDIEEIALTAFDQATGGSK